jgi:hypothetical protein
VARGWGSISREAARTAAYVAAFGLIAYFGMKIVIKVEGTQTRLFLVIVIFGVGFAAATLLDHLLRARARTDNQPNGKPNEIWPRWYSQLNEPIVCRQPGLMPYSYVVLPRRSQRTASGGSDRSNALCFEQHIAAETRPHWLR